MKKKQIYLLGGLVIAAFVCFSVFSTWGQAATIGDSTTFLGNTSFLGVINNFNKGLRVGTKTGGGVAFLNGTLINDAVRDGENLPVTIGDDLRVDGTLFRIEAGGSNPLKIADTIMPDQDSAYEIGTSSQQFSNAYFSGTVYAGGLEGTGIIGTGNLADEAVTGDKVASDGSVVKSVTGDNTIEVTNQNNGNYRLALKTSCSNNQILKWNSTTSRWTCADDSGGGGDGNTLDEAYDEGGSGAGREITVDSGAVKLTGSNAADETLEVSQSADYDAVNLLAGNATFGETILQLDANEEDTGSFNFVEFYSDADGTPDQEFAIDQDGNITNDGTLTVGGDASINGTLFTLDADNAGSGANVRLLANQGSDNDGEIRYNASTDQWELSNDGGAFSAISTGAGSCYWTQNGTDLYYTTGEVGIGTATPDRLLVVSGDAAGEGNNRLELANTGSGAGTEHADIRAETSGSTGGDPLIGLTINSETDWSIGVDNSQDDRLVIGTGTLPGSADILYLTTGGYLGLGGAPDYLVDVTGSGSGAIMNMEDSSTSDDVKLRLATGGDGTADPFIHYTISGDTDWVSGIDNNDSNTFKIGNHWLVSSADDLAITTGGDIGIGQTSPTIRLQVEDDVASSYAAHFFNDGDNANRYGISVQGGDDDGTTGTTYYLTALDGDGGAVGYLQNNSGTFEIAQESDARLKTSITETEYSGLDLIKSLRVVDFNWKENPESEKETGFIAQELQEIYPKMVSKGPDGMLSISQNRLIPFLAKAIQEQQVQIDTLDGRLKRLAENATAEKSDLITLRRGEQKATVIFSDFFPIKPVVTVTLEGEPTEYSLRNVNCRGFEIILSNPAPADLIFHWHASPARN